MGYVFGRKQSFFKRCVFVFTALTCIHSLTERRHGHYFAIKPFSVVEQPSHYLHAFVRNKEEINKEAMLNEPDKAKSVPGVSIVTGVEDFVIVPFEVDTEAAL